MLARSSVFALLFAVMFSAAAHADSTAGYGGGFSGSATLVTTINSDDSSYTIIDVMGDNFDGLLDPGTFHNNDNQLFPNDATAFDSQGFSFLYTMGDTDFDVDIFSPSAGNYSAYLDDSDGFSETIPVMLTVVDPPAPPGVTYWTLNLGRSADTAATPEPSSLVLLGTGLAGALGAAKRRFKA